MGSPSPKKHRVLIVGGGPAGLALAAHLLDNHVPCRVLERRSRAELLADTSSFYDMAASGIQAILRIAKGAAAPAIFASSMAYDKMALFTSTAKGDCKVPLVNVQWKGRSLGMPMFNITRAALLEALCTSVEKLDPDCICFGTNARLVHHVEGTVEVEGPAWGATKQVLTADLVVAADGVHSNLRKRIFGDTGLRSDGIVACYAVLPPLTTAEAKNYPTPQGVTNATSFCSCGMAPDFLQYIVVNKAATIWYINFVVDGKAYVSIPKPARPDGWLGECQDRFANGIPGLEALMSRTNQEDMKVVACYDREPLDSYHRGKVVFIGDAAHPFTPYAGLGARQAMVDAFCLAHALLDHANAKDMEAAAQKYEDQRLKPANDLMDHSRQLCGTSWTYRLQFQIFVFVFWLGNLFGMKEAVCELFMTVDGDSMVNKLVPFKDEKEEHLYQSRYDAAMKSLQSQL